MLSTNKITEKQKLLKSSNPVGVLMGEIGCGKTTLENFVCNTNL
jgi:ABC-type taurine transport system ATPase subunit